MSALFFSFLPKKMKFFFYTVIFKKSDGKDLSWVIISLQLNIIIFYNTGYIFGIDRT